MAHQAIYRKWRPKSFSEILGQTAVITTLQNQILSGQIAHAYLFSGIRGTGKTSTARVFARALNCVDLSGAEPCNKCEFCKGVLEETLIDVIEIDAASNNGVDDIRGLRETIKYPPAQTKYKIYIIDEVHMLSQGAFNALLKTLEEPPHYAIFILATTEPQKIPATILSRCQRYDFKRIKRDELINHLNDICESLDIQADVKALEVIADNSEGALRDAQSILDQCLGGCTDELSYDRVIDVLGMANDDFFVQFINNIFEKNVAAVMKSIDDYLLNGGRIEALLQQLTKYYRDMMLLNADVDTSILNLSSEKSIELLKEHSDKLSQESILWSVDLLGNLSAQLKWIAQPRIHFEMLVIKLIMHNNVDKIENTPIESTTVSEMSENQSENTTDPKNIQSTENISHKDVSFDDIKNQWNDILKDIKNLKVQTHAFIIEGKPCSLDGDILNICFPDTQYEFHMSMLLKDENVEIVQKVLNRRFSKQFMIKCICQENLIDTSNVSNEAISNEQALLDYLGEHSNKLKK